MVKPRPRPFCFFPPVVGVLVLFFKEVLGTEFAACCVGLDVVRSITER